MGCGAYREVVTFKTSLERIKLANYDSSYSGPNFDDLYLKYDEFYARAEQRLREIKTDMDSIARDQQNFIDITGVANQNVNLGYVLLSLVVAIAAENECDVMKFDLQFDSKFPGILLRKEVLSDDNLKVYNCWEEWSQKLGGSINRLAMYIRDLPLFSEYSKVIPDEVLKIAYDQNIPVTIFSQQEQSILRNQENLICATEALNSVISNTQVAIHESTEVIDRLNLVPEIMEGVLKIAAKAMKQNIFTVPEVLYKYYAEIESMIANAPTPQ